MRGQMNQAVVDWGNATNVNTFTASNPANADVVIHQLDVQAWFKLGADVWGYTSPFTCNSAGGAAGQHHIFLDNEASFYLTIANAWPRARWLASHEFGHALGLDHNDSTNGKCGNTPKPASVMVTKIPLMGEIDICGWYSPSLTDVNAINSLYPAPPK